MCGILHTAVVPLDLTPEERAAVIALIEQAPLEADDLVTAIRASMRRRVENSRHGGLVISALHRNGMSWRAMERATGIPQSTLRSWIDAPPATEDEEESDR